MTLCLDTYLVVRLCDGVFSETFIDFLKSGHSPPKRTSFLTQQPIEQHSKQRSATTIKGLSAAGWAESLFSQLKRIIILTTELWTCKLSISLRLAALPSGYFSSNRPILKSKQLQNQSTLTYHKTHSCCLKAPFSCFFPYLMHLFTTFFLSDCSCMRKKDIRLIDGMSSIV